jgi:O-antigen/teichoic acid export membrane protein
MRTFSQISILEAIFHLIAVWILKFIPESRLIYFVILYTAGNLFILFYYVIYCHCRYDICRIRFCVDREYLRSMLSFFSWSLLGAVANMSKQQGLNVLLNVFCGVVLNATWGIATQVGGAVNQFVTSFQQAFNPQILKSYSTSSREEYLNLLQNCSKYSFMLIWIVALPILLQTEFLLKLWLGKDLPAETVIFTQWMVLYMVIDAVSGPLWMAVQATGNIKRYQFEVSCLICSTFLFSFIVLKCGGAAYWVVIINVIINFACLVYRLFYLNKNIQLAIFRFCQKVCFPIIAIGVISYIAGIMLKPLIGNSIGFILIYLFGILVISLVVCLLIGLSKHEKYLLRNLLISRFK